MQDEQSLVRRAQQRDEAAFTQLYEAYFNKIYRYVALRIGDKTEAEDVTQQVFLNALQSISSFRWKGIPFSAWLFRIAHNQVVDYLRKQTKQATVPLDESLVSSDSNPQLVAEHKLDIEQLISATKRLTEAQREVISLRFASELPIAQVAKVMGKSQGAVKALQHSAIVALRKALLMAEDNERE
ncbi:MAG: sigma-70 family RNA polymerase sigma factor [Dehalococcoidales bacterium]|nr:sigma-70 family RNA polymerase sigma factor [Dehalococcoidales bacterium]